MGQIRARRPKSIPNRRFAMNRQTGTIIVIGANLATLKTRLHTLFDRAIRTQEGEQSQSWPTSGTVHADSRLRTAAESVVFGILFILIRTAFSCFPLLIRRFNAAFFVCADRQLHNALWSKSNHARTIFVRDSLRIRRFASASLKKPFRSLAKALDRETSISPGRLKVRTWSSIVWLFFKSLNRLGSFQVETRRAFEVQSG